MTHLVATKLRHLAGEFDDLKVRLRIALAGELARQVATAVGDVVRAVVGPPGSEPDRHWKPSNSDDPWDEDDEEYHAAYAPPIRPDESEQAKPAATTVSANTSVAVAAGVHVARWWLLGRRGTLLGALSAGFHFLPASCGAVPPGTSGGGVVCCIRGSRPARDVSGATSLALGPLVRLGRGAFRSILW